MRLEKVYGPGLLGLRHEETGKVMHERFAWARTLPAASYLQVGDMIFDSETTLSAIMGLADGLQYKDVTKFN